MKGYTTLYFVLWGSLILLLGSCSKDTNQIGTDPYAGGKEPLAVKFADELPSPSEGYVGTAMTFKVYGVKEEHRDNMQFLINGLEAEITSFTDSTITAVLPENVSTGGTRLVIDGQIYPGPICQVSGNLLLDPTYNVGVGANATISTIRRLSNGWILLGGSFSDYNGAAASRDIGGIIRISNTGQYVAMNFGAGATNGTVSSIHEVPGGLLISGNISEFNERELVNNIVLLNSNGTMKGDSVEILNFTDNPQYSKIWAPAFNGGTNLPTLKTFVYNGKVTAIGAFQSYNDYYYTRSTFNNVLMGRYPVGGVVRMNMDGSLDDSFNVNFNLPIEQGQEFHPSYRGIEGFVYDGHMQNDGKLILVGRITRYNNQPVTGNIIRINVDGSLDDTFNSGSGANDGITRISSTPDGKLFITGNFSTYDGSNARGLVLLNADGSVDTSFENKGFSGGVPNFVRQLSNGKVLVSGSFNRYDDIIREGLCVLNLDGSLAEGYNNTGKLDGVIMDVMEGTNTSGQRIVTLVGHISRFNGKGNIGNIMRLVFAE